MHALPLARSSVSGPAMGWQEWAALPDDDRTELVDGRLAGAEVPSWVVGWFVEQLRRWARDHQARVAGSGVRYATGPRSGRMPDVSVFLDGRRPPAHGAALRDAPG